MTRRVVPDVQALVQGVISRQGPAGALLSSWERRDTDLITCEEIVAQFEDVLRRPHIQRKYRHVSEPAIVTFAAALRHDSTFVAVADVPRVVPDDPDDDVVLACAVAGHADYIVSRDRHLLRLGVHEGIPIVFTEAFARILRGQVSEPLGFIYGPGAFVATRSAAAAATPRRRPAAGGPPRSARPPRPPAPAARRR
jgi:putative PIN family toxin of toxin-antitoxin system